jgi:hypothetical protein
MQLCIFCCCATYKMTRNLIFILTFFLTANCYGQSTEELESYSDSITTKEGELYIVQLIRVESKDSDRHGVQIEFFRNSKRRDLINSYEIDKDTLTGCDPKVYDYNGDGNMDYSFVSNLAARGANEVRTLFIFNPKDKSFIHVKNSEQFPNIIYNPKLKCLDSWAFHGGTTQSFLKLEADSLIATYTIDVHGTERVLAKYENGKRIKIKTDSIEDVGFPRYINYDPFEEYEN